MRAGRRRGGGARGAVPDVAGEAWHGVRAWRYFRRHPGYRAAWAAEAGAPVFEAAPFAVRVQSPADLGAARFGLLAWEDPFDAAGFPSALRVGDGMAGAVFEPEAESPVEFVAGGGGARRALRPGDLPQHLADDVDVGGEAGIGRIGGVGRRAGAASPHPARGRARRA